MGTERQKILLVDGDDSFRSEAAAALAGAGFEVIEGATSGEALTLAGTAAPDILVLSVELAPLNGWVVCTRLKKDSTFSGIPVVLLTADATPLLVERHKKLKSHADRYLNKPFPVQELVSVVSDLHREPVAHEGRQDSSPHAVPEALTESVPPHAGPEDLHAAISAPSRHPPEAAAPAHPEDHPGSPLTPDERQDADWAELAGLEGFLQGSGEKGQTFEEWLEPDAGGTMPGNKAAVAEQGVSDDGPPDTHAAPAGQAEGESAYEVSESDFEEYDASGPHLIPHATEALPDADDHSTEGVPEATVRLTGHSLAPFVAPAGTPVAPVPEDESSDARPPETTAQLIERVQSLQELADARTAEAAALESRLLKLESDLEGYRATEQERDQESEQRRSFSERENKEVVELRQRVHELQGVIESQKTTEMNLQTELTRVRGDCARRDIANNALSAKAEKLVEVRLRLESERASLKEDTRAAEREVAQLRVRVDHLSRAATASEEKAAATTAELETRRAELETRRAESDALGVELNHARSVAAQAAADAQDAKRARASLEAELLAAKRESAVLRFEAERREAELQAKKASDEALGRALMAVEARSRKAANLLVAAERSIAQARDAFTQAVADVGTLSTGLAGAPLERVQGATTISAPPGEASESPAA